MMFFLSFAQEGQQEMKERKLVEKLTTEKIPSWSHYSWICEILQAGVFNYGYWFH